MGRDVVAAVGESWTIKSRDATEHTKRDQPNHPTHEGNRIKITKQNQFSLAVVSLNKATKACADIGSDIRSSWVMDSGAGRHLVGDESLLHDAVECDDQVGLTLPNDETLLVTKIGKITFETIVDDEVHEVNLSDV